MHDGGDRAMKEQFTLFRSSLCACFLLLTLGGCITTTIKTPTETELLEKQVLTSFDTFREEVYAMGSVRAVDVESGKPVPPPPTTESKRHALDAQRSREFNRDDIRSFKDRGFVGENK